jgi:hypothetical protein
MVYFLTYYYNATGCIPPPLGYFKITAEANMPDISQFSVRVGDQIPQNSERVRQKIPQNSL